MRYSIVMALAVFLAAPPSSAQPTTAVTQARKAQYVFIIDNSGSMRGTDPDRLAVFAVKSLLSMLDDSDEATVIGLTHKGADVQPLAPLSRNRAALNTYLDRLGEEYEKAWATPCRPALNRARDLLNQSYRADVSQVVFFLTDGKCEPARHRAEMPDAYLPEVAAQADGHLQFYLLRFGAAYGTTLSLYAKQTNGTTSEVSATDPTGLLRPFAEALSRSQGYRAYELSPLETRLGAHRGAVRVRLLAIAPGQGQPMRFKIDPERPDEKPLRITSEKADTHHYPGKGVYRYATLDYRPGTVPVRLTVLGAADAWKLIALPEYRLSLDARFHAGLCGAKPMGQELNSLLTGSDFCVVLRLMSLVDGRWQHVTEDVVGLTSQAVIEYQAPGEEPVEVRPKWVPERGTFESQFVRVKQAGIHQFAPRVTLGDNGGTTHGQKVSLQAAENTCDNDAAHGKLDFGQLRAGESKALPVTFTGDFPPAEARHVVFRQSNAPAGCVSFLLNAAAESVEGAPGGVQTVSSGQGHQVVAKVAPYCGRQSGSWDVQGQLRLEFQGSGLMPTCSVPVGLHIDYQIEPPPAPPEAVVISVDAGDSTTHPITVSGNSQSDYRFAAVLQPPEERPRWPDDDLELAFYDPVNEEPVVDPLTREPALGGEVSFPRAADPRKGLALHVDADTCCAGGSYESLVGLRAADGVAEPMEVLVRVEVTPASVLACWGSTILKILAILLLILLVLYVINMFRQSRFVKTRKLESMLVPLRWDRRGRTERYEDAANDVKQAVRKGLSLPKRVTNWLKANPLVFGLPGKRFRETVALDLSAGNDVFSSLSARLVPERNIMERFSADPGFAVGGLYAVAPKQIVAKYDPESFGLNGGLVPEDKVKKAMRPRKRRRGEEDEPPEVDLNVRNTEFVMALQKKERDEGALAGWVIG